MYRELKHIILFSMIVLLFIGCAGLEKTTEKSEPERPVAGDQAIDTEQEVDDQTAVADTQKEPVPRYKPATQAEELKLIREVEERMYDFMDARMKNDLEKMYFFHTQEFQDYCSLVKYENYPKEATIGLGNFIIHGIEILTTHEANVWISEYFKPAAIPSYLLNVNFVLNWVKIGDEWYYNRKVADQSKTRAICGGSPEPDEMSEAIEGVCGS